MRSGNMVKGIFLILGIAHLLALIVLAFIKPVDLTGSFSIILMIECAACFTIAATGGITVPTKRVQGDKNPDHYTHDTWTGGGGFSADNLAFLMSGTILLLESLAMGLIVTL